MHFTSALTLDDRITIRLNYSGEGSEYSGDLNNEHLKNRNIGLLEVQYSDARFLLPTGQENSGQIVPYSDHYSNNRLKKSSIQITIQLSDHF